VNTEQLQLVTEVQAAKMLAVSVAALRRWRREKRGPEFTRLERCVRYSIHDIERFLKDNSSSNKKAADRKSAAKREMRNVHATAQT
jgi:Helix-turn-helix domain